MEFPREQHFAIQVPPLFDATPTSLKEDAERLIATTFATWDSVVSEIQPEHATFDNTIVPIFQDENARSAKRRVLCFYASTHPSKDMRDASNAVATLFNDAEIESFSRQDMFLRVDEVMRQQERRISSSLDAESLYYLQKLHRRFHQNGCAIAEQEKRSDFKAKMKRLDDLVRHCNMGFHEESSGIWLRPDELDGVPQWHIDRLKPGEGENSSYLWLPTKSPFSGPALSCATREGTRKRMYYAVQNRLSKNALLFREIVLLRDETARTLGYPNHATLKTADKMMQTPQAVEKLLSDLRRAVTPLAVQDSQELQEMKREEAEARGAEVHELYFWDVSYYSRQRDDKDASLKSSVSEYFELNTTLAKLLDMIEHLFGARFRKIDVKGRAVGESALVWHKDVEMYSVWDVDGSKEEFLGYAYLDFFPRDGKYTHRGCYSLQQAYQKTNGSRFYPSAALVMNYAPPSDSRPTLLGLWGARKLFHELGHVLHSLFTQTKFAALNVVDRDFVEAPSRMLERFFWVERHIKEVSFHYSHISSSMKEAWKSTIEDRHRSRDLSEKPVQLGDDIVRDLARSTEADAMENELTSLFFATYDMLVHTPASHTELENLNLTELFNKTRSDIFKVSGGEALGEGWEWSHGQTTFRNILNRYDAGYYSYILGSAFALDMFDTGFKKDTTSPEAGRRYRDMVLRVGGRQPEMKTLTDYLGHAPSPGPYIAWLQGARDQRTQPNASERSHAPQ
ncbi:metallopeptidase [Purpureocillium lilacinum]|uniref:Metallopeptidase n=1 Tax=Purpureocillium lilacinum TaxID=33203 RepID=A0A179GZL2_PURLI|nr:metallopeptidase [Purpureocillium lilacinum]OAQ82559.1 metallopeptidase [Purpureocillium lilacinum]